jgi:ABC-type glycerol-3-phosphate transport system substrate-binding protein
MGGRNAFNNGQVAMQFIGASNLNLYYPIDQFTWDWRPLPAGKAGPKSWGGGNVWSVSSKAQLVEEGWSLLQHITNVESQTALAIQYFPPRKRSAQQFLDAEAKAGRPPKNRNVILDVMNNAYVRPAHPRYGDVQKVFDEELGTLWAQGGSAQTAADSLKRRVDPILQGR